MKKKLFVTAVFSALVSEAHAADMDHGVKFSGEKEKCYGVAKAGKNDCASKNRSHMCAMAAKKDADPNEWVYMPAGLCDKLSGGIIDSDK